MHILITHKGYCLDTDTKIEYMNTICEHLGIQLTGPQLQVITLFDVYNIIVRSARRVGETTALVIAMAIKLLAGEKVLVLSDMRYEHDDLLNRLFTILAGVSKNNYPTKKADRILLSSGGELNLHPFRPESFIGKHYDTIVLLDNSQSTDKAVYVSRLMNCCDRIHLFSNTSLHNNIPPETIELYMRY